MQSSQVVSRITKFSKLWKFNVFLLIMLMLAGSLAISYAGDPKALVPGKCGAKIALVLDRSSSIGVSQFGGNQGNVDAIKSGSQSLFNAIQGVDSYTDVYAFGSVAKRINSGPWFNVKDQDSANWQSMVMHGTKFKTGATNSSSGDLYDDGMAAGSEGLTNWEDALRAPIVSHTGKANDPWPDAIIIFTDGEPTTNNAETNAAIAAGGSYTAAGNPGVDGTDADDLSAGFNMANFARAIGIRVIPVAIGDFSGANGNNLQTLAAGETVYKSNNFGDLGNLLKSAAADVCTKPVKTTVALSGIEKTPTGYKNIVLPIVTSGPFVGTINTTGNAQSPWATKDFNVDSASTWDFRMTAQLPEGYRPISERCERDKWNGQAPFIEEKDNSVGVNGHILIQGQAPGGITYCEFVIEKIPATPIDKIELDKTVNPTQAKPGQVVTYSFVAKNTGTSTLKNVKVTDPMLGGQVGETIASLAPGASSAVITKTYTIPNDAKDVIHNVATVTGTPTNADGTTRPNVTDDDPADVTVVASPINAKIELIKSGPETAKPGEKVTFTFSVKNTGNTDLTNIVITDETLSKYLDKPVSIKIDGTLKVGATSALKTLDFTIPKDYKESTFKNIAVVTANPINPDTGVVITTTKVTDDDDHIIAFSKWTATKVADKKVVVAGDTVTYTISVTNNGGTTLKNVEVSDPTIGFPKDGKPVVIPEIKAGETKSVTATYVVPKNYTGKTFKNVAVVCVPGTTKECQNPEAEIKIINISIVKSADKESAVPGDKVIYKFVVTNTGGADIDPTPVNDDVLGVIGNPGVLKPGESVTYTKEYTVPTTAKAGDKIINIVTVCASVQPTEQATTNAAATTDCVTTCPEESLTTVCDQDTHTLTVIIPKITIVKTADKTTAAPGDSVVYTFVITNVSTVDVFGVKVTDNVLGDLGTIDKIAAGASVTKSVTYVVPTTATGTIRNVATACFTTPVIATNCASDDHVLSIVVVAGETVTRVSPAALPFTGASSAWMAVVAAMLLMSGVAIYVLSRKRKTA